MSPQHRTVMPLTRTDARTLATRVWTPLQRPVMGGVDVSDASFDEWLRAGGERRARPRDVSACIGLGGVPVHA